MPQGYNATYTDPQSGKQFTVFEGHYSYGGINFVPSWGGSMFEGLMNNLVIPETTWGPHSFGLNDQLYAKAQIAYATQTLHYPSGDSRHQVRQMIPATTLLTARTPGL